MILSFMLKKSEKDNINTGYSNVCSINKINVLLLLPDRAVTFDLLAKRLIILQNGKET